jgi:hypothetical protein
MDHILRSTDLEADYELLVAHVSSFYRCDPSRVHTVVAQLAETVGDPDWGNASVVLVEYVVHLGRYHSEGLLDSKELDREELAVDRLWSRSTAKVRRLSIGSC